MSGTAFDKLCEAYGVQLSYESGDGQRVEPGIEARRAILSAMQVDVSDEAAIAASLAAAPKAAADKPAGKTCYLPGWLEQGKAWGVTCQLYGLRSARNQGIGDFEDLACLAEMVAGEGADFLGVNPVHALFTADPERCSPFSPSSRGFLNPVYIALDRVPGLADEMPEDSKAEIPKFVDYPAVMGAKLSALGRYWQRLESNPSLWQTGARKQFDSFVKAGGTALRNHALFEALSHHMVAQGKGAGWHGWPDDYKSPASPAVKQFAKTKASDVGFHLWLQWIADRQLAEADRRAKAAGMRIGLYLDFAVGTAPDGSATWSDPELVVSGANIGAPPDGFFEGGQDWGLAPVSPAALRRGGLAAYREMLEGAMRHAGAIRIDHAMGLQRLFWVPHGMGATEGCYVHYPLAAMVDTLAGASRDTSAIVIGEDLGTVPHGFSDVMRDAAMLSCRVLYFEWVRGHMRAKGSYRRNAFVSVSTHDLPPLAAWWSGFDIDHYLKIGLIDEAGAAGRRKDRANDRIALLDRLRRDLPAQLAATLPVKPKPGEAVMPPAIAAAAHAFLARTPSRLVGLQFEDLCGAVIPVNVPGTVEGPNWRVRAPQTLEEVAKTTLWRSVTGAVAAARPKTP